MLNKLHLLSFCIVLSTTLLYTSAKTTDKKIDMKDNIQVPFTPETKGIELTTSQKSPQSPSSLLTDSSLSTGSEVEKLAIIQLSCCPKACYYCPKKIMKIDVYGCWKKKGHSYHSFKEICFISVAQIICCPFFSIVCLANVISMKCRKKGRIF